MEDKVIELAPFDECTGCAACSDACPKQAIRMEYKKCFLYPVIDNDQCIQCGKCTRTCPILKSEPEYEILDERKSYYGYSIDKNHLSRSSSGSFSYTLNKVAIQNGWVVYGVAFDGDGTLRYKRATNIDEIENFIGSKYIQACSESIYKQVKEEVRNGYKVLFTGLPCVLSGVRNYLNAKELENVIFVKIICHGVSSALIFNQISNYLERKYKSKILLYNFRSKAFGWKRQSVEIRFENGKVINQLALDNLHHYWFAYHWNLRLSCFHCRHRTYDEADLIIGDWWGAIDAKPQVKHKQGLSVVIVNTSKGKHLLRQASNLLILNEVDIKSAIDRQPPLYQNPKVPEEREAYIEDFSILNFNDFVEKYKRRPNSKEKIKKHVFNIRFRLTHLWK